jgi:mRNA-degrading endonuclease toxin of MazEF toxin-antitoxin module
MFENLKRGDIILSPFSQSDLLTNEARPSLVLHHDLVNRQLVVAYITSQVDGPVEPCEKLILIGSATFVKAGLVYDSKLKLNQLVTIKRILVKRKIGEADDDLREWVNQTIPTCLAI